ncbi:MAG: DUF1552 domain-containing protein [Opitutaceae bacterium]|jgi:hypothetical protein|nr:DUF1552 domain-containing protein [Opitutaceae bacterium]
MNPRGHTTVNRRHFLKAAATLIALPKLESLASAAEIAAPAKKARNFVSVGSYLGLHQNAFFPKEVGRDFTMPETLKPLTDHRDSFSVFSGLDHRAPNGHKAWTNFLCGNTPNAYSLDQMVADQIGQDSRFPSIQLTAGTGEGTKAMSFTKRGIGLPMIQRPSVFYNQMFMSAADKSRMEHMLRSGKSSLDNVLDDALRLQKSVPSRDRDKLDEYFDSLRSVEKRMEHQIASINDPVPTTDYRLPDSDPITPNLLMEAETLMYDLMALALENESSRVLSMFLDGLGQVFSIDGEPLKAGYHGLSHHGNDPAMIRDLVKIERSHVQCLSNFITQLKEKKGVDGRALIDDTIILMGTGMGDASRHSNRNLPTLVAGGGFDHGRHIAVDQSDPNAPLLGDLYVTLMQKLDLEVGSFSNASRNMNQLFS